MQADGELSIEVNEPEENLAAAEQMAESVMTARDAHRAHKADLSNVEQLRRSYGIDVEEFAEILSTNIVRLEYQIKTDVRINGD